MQETPGSVFRLDGFAQDTQPLICLLAFCFPIFFFFLRRYLKGKLLRSQSVLTLLKILVTVFFLCNIRNAVSILAVLQACNFFNILQHGFKFSTTVVD